MKIRLESSANKYAILENELESARSSMIESGQQQSASIQEKIQALEEELVNSKNENTVLSIRTAELGAVVELLRQETNEKDTLITEIEAKYASICEQVHITEEQLHIEREKLSGYEMQVSELSARVLEYADKENSNESTIEYLNAEIGRLKQTLEAASSSSLQAENAELDELKKVIQSLEHDLEIAEEGKKGLVAQIDKLESSASAIEKANIETVNVLQEQIRTLLNDISSFKASIVSGLQVMGVSIENEENAGFEDVLVGIKEGIQRLISSQSNTRDEAIDWEGKMEVIYRALSDCLTEESQKVGCSIMNLNKRLEAFERSAAHIRTLKDSLLAYKNSCSALQDRNEQLSHELRSANSSLAILRDEINVKDSDIADMAMKLQELHSSQNMFAEEKTTLQTEIERLQREKEYALSKSDDTQALATQISDLENAVHQKNAHIMKIDDRLKEADKIKQDLEQKLEARTNDRELLLNELDCARTRVGEYDKSNAALESIIKDHPLSNGQESASTVDIVRNILKNLQDRVSELKAEIESRSSDSDSSAKLLASLQEKLQSKDEQIKAQAKAIESQRVTINKFSKDGSVLYDKYQAAKKKIESLHSEIKSIEYEKKKINQKLEILQAQNQQFIEKKNKFTEGNRSLEAQVSHLESSLQLVISERDVLRGQLASAMSTHEESSDMRDQMEQMKSEALDLKSLLVEKEEIIRGLRAESENVSRVENELSDARRALHDAQVQIKALDEELVRFKTNRNAFSLRYISLIFLEAQDVNEAAAKHIAKYEKELNLLKKDMSDLRRHLEVDSMVFLWLYFTHYQELSRNVKTTHGSFVSLYEVISTLATTVDDLEIPILESIEDLDVLSVLEVDQEKMKQLTNYCLQVIERVQIKVSDRLKIWK